MAYFEKHSMVLSDLARQIHTMGLFHAFTLQWSWSQAAILQFYATCFFDGEGRLSWRTHHTTITISYAQWCEALGMPISSDDLFQIHNLNDEFEPMAIDKCMACLMPTSETPKDVKYAPKNPVPPSHDRSQAWCNSPGSQ